MKRLYIATALLLMVVTSCVLTHRYQHRQLHRMLTKLEHIEQLAYDGEMDQATALAKEFAEEYLRVSDRISCYVAHSELRESRETAILLPALLQQNSEVEWQMEINRLRSHLLCLQRVDDPLLQNIL